jgi:hypothetical protein
MKPNVPMLAITTSLITHSPAAIRRNDFPINIAAQRYGDLLGFTSFSPTYQNASRPERTFVYMVVRKSLSKCHSTLTPCPIRSAPCGAAQFCFCNCEKPLRSGRQCRLVQITFTTLLQRSESISISLNGLKNVHGQLASG